MKQLQAQQRPPLGSISNDCREGPNDAPASRQASNQPGNGSGTPEAPSNDQDIPMLDADCSDVIAKLISGFDEMRYEFRELRQEFRGSRKAAGSENPAKVAVPLGDAAGGPGEIPKPSPSNVTLPLEYYYKPPASPTRPFHRTIISGHLIAQSGDPVRREQEPPRAAESAKATRFSFHWPFTNTSSSIHGVTPPEYCPMYTQEELNIEIAKIYSTYSQRVDGLNHKLEKEKNEKDELNDQLQKEKTANDGLKRELQIKARKMQTMSKTLTRAGRSDNQVMDEEIKRRFGELKSDVQSLLRHFSLKQPRDGYPHAASPAMPELLFRQMIADQLHEHFFSPNAMLFGLDDAMLPQNPLKKFERSLQDGGCDDAILREWRVASVKACHALNPTDDMTEFVSDRAHCIWGDREDKEGRGKDSNTLRNNCIHRDKHDREQAFANLKEVCRKAASLALLFRSSSFEYKWEQPYACLKKLHVSKTDHEIIGTTGVDPNRCPDTEYQIRFIVFGGVARGHRTTGLLRDGKVRITKSLVVIEGIP